MPRPKGATSSTTTASTTSSTPQAEKRKTYYPEHYPEDFFAKTRWVFESLNGSPAHLILSNPPKTAVKNPETGVYDKIRFCENEREVFISEQPEVVNKTDVVLTDGSIVVTPTQQNLLKFLFLHPEYGKRFSLSDAEGRAKENLKNADKVLDAMQKAQNANLEELRSISMVLGFNTESEWTMRDACMDYARENPVRFINMFSNPMIEAHALVREGVQRGVLTTDDNEISWSDGSRILVYPQGQEPQEYLARTLIDQSDKSEALLKELTKRLGK